ncbi:hypothetical protein RSOLAG22IIIB_05919 [Rhizoctonia solani]|uniref:AMP-dependent synthetase/ligase domain-containing protein n=1 Tax=Rhizoctonia solani TaxID=456999 RepID=A0A0K6GA62_9AGAM|nr:hypothetical protein RSOLAG22IIIB_05919 [Rhizoctonia solani]
MSTTALPYSGPGDNDSLTEDELRLLLAIPHAAESTPDATLLRLSLGRDPSMGWIDATCAETRSIVRQTRSKLPVGPGTTICIMDQPKFHGIFHLFAFWALGCTVQYISPVYPTRGIKELHESGCKVMLYSGIDDEWINASKKQFNGVTIQLPKEERADQLVKSEKHRQASTLPWPVPQRPTPALIVQSSGTTGYPKPVRLSLYSYTIRLTQTCQSYLRATYEAHAEFFRSLYSFSFTGSTMNNALSRVFEELEIAIVNLYGLSEIGRVLYAAKPPYTHLRPCYGVPPPLVYPISDYDAEGSRYVELWITPTRSPNLAHCLVYGSVPIKLEPFPGDGPHKGELALNLEDIFQEVPIKNVSDPATKTAYIHVGRHTDGIRLGEGGFGNIDGGLYEATVESEVNARIGRSGNCPWTLDGVQLFGNNMTCTALVIQLRPNQTPVDGCKDLPIHELHESVEQANISLGLTGCKRVHPEKRTLIVSSDGTFMHGEGSERLPGSSTLLSLTHKRTPKRWENVCRFKPWLDGLDFSDI